jgi:hypothetical protein
MTPSNPKPTRLFDLVRWLWDIVEKTSKKESTIISNAPFPLCKGRKKILSTQSNFICFYYTIEETEDSKRRHKEWKERKKKPTNEDKYLVNV